MDERPASSHKLCSSPASAPPSSPSRGDPLSSPLRSDPPSSPLRSEPPSSPLRSEPPSSPMRSEPPFSPPVLCLSSSATSSDEEKNSKRVKKRRKKYEFHEPEVPFSAGFWKPSEKQDVAGTMMTERTGAIQENVLSLTGSHSESECITDQVDDHNNASASSVGRTDLTESSSSAESSASSIIGDSSSGESSVGQDSDSTDDFSAGEESETEDIDSASSDSDDNFASPPVYPGCPLTVDEAVLDLMELFIKKKMEKVEIGAILKSILKFIPKFNHLPRSQHTLFQYVERLSPIPQEQVHYYCSVCLYYLGEAECNCSLCGGVSHKFYQLSLSDQIRTLFENHNLAEAIDKYSAKRQDLPLDGSYRDICDGSEFKRSQIDGQYNLVLQAHTDGINVSKSSNMSLWPYEYAIANLPPHLRFKFVIINGIWLDNCKPNLNSYLKPFANELRTINNEGIKWRHPQTGEEHTTYVAVSSFCGDAPVRASIQNILSHGGKHCCNICEQKMKKLPAEPIVPGKERKRRRRVFTFQERAAVLRTAERMEEQGRKSREEQEKRRSNKLIAKKGVKGRSVVSIMPGCDRSTVVYPEYMHLVLCLLKEFLKLWFEIEGPWSLKQHRDSVNKALESIRVPDYITRVPRSTEHYSKWKAHELRAFLLYYSLIILSQCMQEKYFQHWLLLVTSIYLLLQETVTANDVEKAGIMLNMFCRDFAKLYTNDAYTYYVHNLLHLPISCERHGPAWNSAFQFESFNGTLAKFIHGTKNQGKELINNVKLAFGVEVLRARCQQESSGQANRPSELRNKVVKPSLTKAEWELLSAHNFGAPIDVFYRAFVRRETYTSSLYQRQKKRNNYTICFKSSAGEKKFGEIRCFCKCGSELVAIVQPFRVDHQRVFQRSLTKMVINHIIPIQGTNEIVLIRLSDILHKVIRVDHFVCLRPNNYEYNL